MFNCDSTSIYTCVHNGRATRAEDRDRCSSCGERLERDEERTCRECERKRATKRAARNRRRAAREKRALRTERANGAAFLAAADAECIARFGRPHAELTPGEMAVLRNSRAALTD